MGEVDYAFLFAISFGEWTVDLYDMGNSLHFAADPSFLILNRVCKSRITKFCPLARQPDKQNDANSSSGITLQLTAHRWSVASAQQVSSCTE
jgi:hypothetical protein